MSACELRFQLRLVAGRPRTVVEIRPMSVPARSGFRAFAVLLVPCLVLVSGADVIVLWTWLIVGAACKSRAAGSKPNTVA